MKKATSAGAVTLESLPWYIRFIRYMRRYWFLYLLVVPGLAFMLVFEYGPMYGIQLAFKDYHANLGIWGSPWVGLDNFRTMVNDSNFWRAFKNTVIINCYMFSGTEYYVDFTNNDWWTAVSNPTDFSSNWATETDNELVQKARDTVSAYVDKVHIVLPSYYNMIALPSEATDIISKLSDTTNEYLAQFIGGQLDVDTSWADYVKAYQDAGAADLETMINEAVATARTTYATK